jgi:quercetin dioxygenase-like cupin family protein
MLDQLLIEKAIKDRKIHVFKNAFPDTPKWETMLAIIAKYVARDVEEFPDKGHLSTKNLGEAYLSFQLRCRFWSRLTYQLFDPKDPLESDVKELIPILDWAKNVYGNRFANTFSLVSLMANRGQVGLKHSDEVDQFQWNCRGTSLWRTGEDLEVETYIEPGDFIFIPKGINHEIETLTPRFVINLVISNE